MFFPILSLLWLKTHVCNLGCCTQFLVRIVEKRREERGGRRKEKEKGRKERRREEGGKEGREKRGEEGRKERREKRRKERREGSKCCCLYCFSV